jgi:mannose-6-phosphate isomerase-like protein (cupin superfamily)
VSFAIRRAPGWKTLAPWIAAAVLGTGWLAREAAHAAARVEKLASTTVNLGDVAMKEFAYEGKPVGQVGVYVQGDTPASTKFVTGRFVLQPGQTPHAPHIHDEEEVMVIEKGTGEIFCDGKTTKIGPGSVMYTTPNAPHGIVNTGKEPIVFYFIKWTPKG